MAFAAAAGQAVGPSESRLVELRRLVAHRDHTAAREEAQQLLEDIEEAGLETSPAAAEIMETLAHLLHLEGEGRSPQALALAEQALALHHTLFGEASLEAAHGMVTLADVLIDRRQFDGARVLLDDALARLAALDATDGVEAADAHRSLGNLLVMSNDPSGARTQYQRSLDIIVSARGADDPGVPELLVALASATRRCGDLDAARAIAERAVAASEHNLGTDHPLVGKALNTLAIILRSSGDLAGARRCLERALEIFGRSYGADDPRVAGLLNNLGGLVRDAGDLVAAREYLERSLAIRERTLGPNHPDVAQSLNNLALVAQRSGDLEGARDYLQRSLAIRERALGPDHLDVAAILTNLGELHADMGELAAARNVDERALAIRTAALGADHPLVAESLHNLAIVLANLGEIGPGRDDARRALEIWRHTLGDGHPRTAIATLTVARFDVLAGQGDAAIDGALRAEDIGRDVFWFNTQQLAERDALLLAEVREGGRDLALTLLAAGAASPGRAGRVWEAVARSRALVLSVAGSRRRISAESADPAISAARDALDAGRSELASALVHAWSSPGPDGEAAVVEARNRVAVEERALAAISRGFARDVDAAELSLSDVATALPETTALVSIVRYDSDRIVEKRETRASDYPPRPSATSESIPSYLAFVLRHGEPTPLVVPLGTAATIDTAIDTWSVEVSRGALVAGRSPADAMAAYRAAGTELRRLVWDPIVSSARGSRLVLMVPDGEFHRISWASLPDDAEGFLVDTGPMVHVLSAERDVLALQHGHTHGHGLLALGGVSYDATLPPDTSSTGPGHAAAPLRGPRSDCRGLQGVTFSALPGTTREIDAVTSTWNRTSSTEGDDSPDAAVVLRGAHATEAAFRANAGGRQILHLATHGFALTTSCGDATMPGLRGIGGLAPAASAPLQSPSPPVKAIDRPTPESTGTSSTELGVLSGLAVAGANRREAAGADSDDGILTAEEISALDLDGVEWVVLSACDTGAGEVWPGEGVIGLQRAFRVAGAHTVIMSLWAVDDDAARAFMEALYSARLNGRRSTPDAMHAATLGVLATRRERRQSTHPFYWAGFVATGDWS